MVEFANRAIRHSYTGWSDVALSGGWHVQRHVDNNIHRLVDPKGSILAEGLAAAMMERWQEQCGAEAAASDRVLLLHGLSRTGRIYNRLGKALAARGFTVLVLGYPSLRQSLDEHAQDMRHLLDHQPGRGRISLVGHSLGGLLVHSLAGTEGAWREKLDLRAAVLITVPHKGSRFGARIARYRIADRLVGPSLEDCLPGRQRLASFGDLPVLNVLGLTGWTTGFNPVLGSDNDFILTEEEMRLGAPANEIGVISPHGLIYRSPTVTALVCDFLMQAHGMCSCMSLEQQKETVS